MVQDYESYLRTLHAGFTTSEDVVREIVAEVSKATITTKRRIVAGEANEVYDITLADGLGVIVRILRNQPLAHDRERWAIDRCRAAGVKVPDILLAKVVTLPGQALAFCVQRKIEGVTLTPPVIAKLTETERKHIVHDVAAMLVRTHSIPTAGRGYIDGDGKGEAAPTSEVLEAAETEYMTLAARSGIEAASMQAILADLLPAWAALSPYGCLVHNDFRAAHVMVDGGKVSGIIDWGEAASGDPVDDFAKWDYWDGVALPTAWLKDAYESEVSLDVGFAEKLRIKKLEFGLCVLSYYASQKYEKGVKHAARNLLTQIKQNPRDG